MFIHLIIVIKNFYQDTKIDFSHEGEWNILNNNAEIYKDVACHMFLTLILPVLFAVSRI
jgi:hypothetical protein